MRAKTSSPAWNGESVGPEIITPATSGQGINSRGLGGGKFFGQRSSPAQGAHALTWIRCSPRDGLIVGVGRVVSERSFELAFGWMIPRILDGRLAIVKW